MLDLQQNPAPATLAEIWSRTVRLGTSIQDFKPFKAIPLVAGANLLRHDCKSVPRMAMVQITGGSASTVQATVDPAITAHFVTIHSTGIATADVVLWL